MGGAVSCSLDPSTGTETPQQGRQGWVPWETLVLVTHPPQVCPKRSGCCPGFGGAQGGLKEGFLCFHYEHLVPAVGEKPCTALRS